MAEEPALVNALEDRITQRDILPILGAVRLEPLIAVKLTVCRERSIKRFHHQIRVALIKCIVKHYLNFLDDHLV